MGAIPLVKPGHRSPNVGTARPAESTTLEGLENAITESRGGAKNAEHVASDHRWSRYGHRGHASRGRGSREYPGCAGGHRPLFSSQPGGEYAFFVGPRCDRSEDERAQYR